ncbi:hypothetical protein [Curtobacterium sp. BH-2-1-1]|uniref:hypothetical protein n=1 Tax=Curtobacterium sp. BH-2-1-1 TaxID=1905847 RepID=UPI0016435E4D|nr:hypothetical protein [Curtobacterium sp. BH-2-1-1]
MPDTTPSRTATAPTRKDVLALLSERGYAGPTSFTVTVLRRVLDWVRAGGPADQADGIPAGVLFAVHPDLRPQLTKAKRISQRQQAVLDALVEVQAVLSNDGATKAKAFLADKINELSAA